MIRTQNVEQVGKGSDRDSDVTQTLTVGRNLNLLYSSGDKAGACDMLRVTSDSVTGLSRTWDPRENNQTWGNGWAQYMQMRGVEGRGLRVYHALWR